jgi:hypothetical protein
MKKNIFLLLVFWLSIESFAQKHTHHVCADTMMQWVDFFAHPDKKGRLSGTHEYDVCAQFVIDKMKSWGVQSLPNYPQYKQNVPVERNVFVNPCDFKIMHFNKGTVYLEHGVDYNFRGFTGSGNMSLETVFCGYGISAENYDDYADVDVRDKAVLIFKGNPKLSNQIVYEPFSIQNRAETAYKHGAKTVIFIPQPHSDRTEPIGSVMCGAGDYIEDLPLIQLSEETANLLFDGTGWTSEKMHQRIEEISAPFSLVLPSKIMVNVQTVYSEAAESYNILGYIEGTDPKLKHEYVMITAHLDHVGSQCDVVYPGANDNASGSAAVMMMAKLLSQNKPLRSVIFCLFTAEESGIIGAEHMGKNMPVNPASVVAVFNLDCIAVGDSIQIGNGLSSPNLYEVCKGFDNKNLMVKDTWRGGGADLSPFHKLGIPGLYFVSRYSYTHLHLPTDTPETLNKELFQTIVGLCYQTARSVANGNYLRETVKP